MTGGAVGADGKVGVRLELLGLAAGERVRFKRVDRRRWQEGVVTGVERDGSLAVRDVDGSFRAIPIDRIEVRVEGKRGRRGWELLFDRLARTEQLRLF